MTSNHIGLLSAAPTALGPASCKPSTSPVASPCSVSSRTYRAIPDLPFGHPQYLWLLIIDNTHGAAVNPCFKGGKGSPEHFRLVRVRGVMPW